MSAAENKHQVVTKFVEELLLDEKEQTAISPALISDKIDMVLGMQPKWSEGLDRQAVTDELIRRFSLWIGQDTTLENNEGHLAWLDSARKREWRYWQRYRDWLEGKLSWKAVDALDRSTDAILGLLEDPLREDCWDRRGLVVGHVQSGKTGSYTGLVCKAADAGYKIIIVLAGLHNNLRSQTQIRLDEGFLGFATNPNPEVIEFVGAGAKGRDAHIKPNCATNRADTGDFNKRVAKHLAITPEQRPWLFVVKKNKSVLKLLLEWIRNHASNAVDPRTGRKIVTHLPLLIVDDEADHASVDTGEQVFDADGQPDEDHQPKAINSLIRRILHAFSRSAYVGYTATPFANIFIHERGETREEGPDLFPAAFIHNLAAPSDYVGPTKVFGLASPNGRKGGLPLVRTIGDNDAVDGVEPWIPPKHKNGHLPRHKGLDTLPPSLVEAIDAFLLASSVRNLRGQAADHSSMLVHVTRFVSVQNQVYRQVDEHIRQLRQRMQRQIGHEGIVERLKVLWESDFVPTTERVSRDPQNGVSDGIPKWEEIMESLPQVISDIHVRMINGSAKDTLDYSEHRERGLKVIAIGGDKLSRGLTLEGLCVSYFLRASKMYDTLMQMGRWFGYRTGYVDLCRLYTTQDLSEWFGHIADAAEELREEFDLMASRGSIPRDYGLKVQSHPVLMVTSQLKMRSARDLRLSFSGQLVETVSLHRGAKEITSNLKAAQRLIEMLGTPSETDPVRSRSGRIDRWSGTFLWSDAPSSIVVDFLVGFSTHPAAHKVNSGMLAEFIQSMSKLGELTRWTIAVLGGGTGAEFELVPNMKIRMNKRSGESHLQDRYSIGRLLDPKDEAIDLLETEWLAAVAQTQSAWKPDPARMHDTKLPDTPNGPAIRRIRGFGIDGIGGHPERGLLLIYALDPQLSGIDFAEGTLPVIAFGISFPGSNSGLKVDYKVNNILWEQEYGPAD